MTILHLVSALAVLSAVLASMRPTLFSSFAAAALNGRHLALVADSDVVGVGHVML